MRRVLLIAAILALAGGVAVFYVGGRLAAPSPGLVGAPPNDLPVEAVQLTGEGGKPIRGWFMTGHPGRGAVLLLHALRADRRSMIGRARFLHRAGYAVLMIDFQAHGESPGENITFGYREARDARAAAQYLKNRLPGESLGVIGVSLGGAAALLGDTRLPADALVLEAVYPSLERAVENRIVLRLSALGRYLAPLLLWQVGPRLGFDPGALAPIERLSGVDAPVLIIGGSEDRHTTAADTRALFERAAMPKTLWMIDNAAHRDFHTFARQEYENRILEFFQRHLR